jgi:hypothetical protein
MDFLERATLLIQRFNVAPTPATAEDVLEALFSDALSLWQVERMTSSMTASRAAKSMFEAM